MRAYVHRGMVTFSEREYRGESLEALHYALDVLIRWHRKWYGVSLAEAKRAAQVSQNHRHMPSKRAAQAYVDEAVEAMRRDHPDLARHLVADWRQGHRRERGNAVLLSFWLDAPTREHKRATRRMLEANAPEAAKILYGRRGGGKKN